MTKEKINGWPVISRLLCKCRKNQSDIARLLGVTPAAVTQIKHGDFKLSGGDLERILSYLNATQEECAEFYSGVITARLYGANSESFRCHAKIERIKK
ncbi:MAG: helix-turn-helix transcriptional regulator [Lentisphaeria bacterium]|nr:helix-turn-helix transcriptional regulator [Lentisphaeria bacterium]